MRPEEALKNMVPGIGMTMILVEFRILHGPKVDKTVTSRKPPAQPSLMLWYPAIVTIRG